MKKIEEKDKAYKVSFKSNTDRNFAKKFLSDLKFSGTVHYKENKYLFISTYDKTKIFGWDTAEIFKEKDDNIIKLSSVEFFNLCKETLRKTPLEKGKVIKG